MNNKVNSRDILKQKLKYNASMYIVSTQENNKKYFETFYKILYELIEELELQGKF